jgi:hypothetical protein
MQCPPTDPQFPSGFGPITIAFIQSAHNEAALVLLEIDLVSGSGVGRQNQFGTSANGKWEISGGNLMSG